MHNVRQQSNATYPLYFYMVDSADHIAGKTGLSPTVTISKNGAAFASPAGAVTEVANGWYKIAGNTTDSNTLGELLIHATGTGADPTDKAYTIVAYDPFSRLQAQLFKNTAASNFHFQMTDSGTHLPMTGLVDANFTAKTVALDAAAPASLGGTVAEVGGGIYRIALTAGETNGNVATYRFAAAGADSTTITVYPSA